MKSKKRIIFGKDNLQNLKQMTIRIDHDLHLKMKAHLALKDMSIGQWLNEAVKKELKEETWD